MMETLGGGLLFPNINRFLLSFNCYFFVKDGAQPRLAIAGGKGVGKSTFLRFLVNRVLVEIGGPVLVVDLDPGQAEFTVPGLFIIM
jgi:ABC-type phosphate/phosphonate transport system ATPase subunit